MNGTRIGIVAGLIVFVIVAGGVAFLQRDQTHRVVPAEVATTTENPGTSNASTSVTASVPPSTVSTAHTSAIDVHAISLGDGKVSTTPKAGYVYACQTTFRGGGADHAGDWIQGVTWDLTKKISVAGSVSWPSAAFSTYLEGVQRMLSGNGLPVGSKTGIFPIQSSDAAYQFDRNPNSIRAYTVSILVPEHPVVASSASCVPMGAIGYALNGVAIYNALDDSGRDAVAHEVQDSCDGHPQSAGEYHYHGPSNCMPHVHENNALVGYALDGFGIYSLYDANGREYTNADLDACHGITSPIMWDGKMVTMYHYVLTQEYPYTVGCFRGAPVSLHAGQATQTTTSGASARSGGSPPAAATSACSGKAVGTPCSFTGQMGTVSGTCKTPPGSSLACVP